MPTESHSSSEIVESDLLDSDQDASDSLDIAIGEHQLQDSIHMAVSAQDARQNQIHEHYVSHSSVEAKPSNTRDRTRETGELNFDALMMRCEDDMELVIAVLEAFCSQGAASCCALEFALEMKEDSQLLLEAV